MNRPRRCTGPTISVVMTVYDPQPEYFRKAVRSILDQSWTDLELIVVEDPSPRDGESMLQGLSDPRLRYLTNPERTCLPSQKNQGLQAAKGKFIALMDADDVAAPTRLADQLEYLHAHPQIDVLGSQITVIDSRDKVIAHRRFPLEHEAILKALPRVVPLSQPSVMFRREIFESFGGYQLAGYAAAEDYEVWSRWIQQGVRFANHRASLLSYRLHPGQTKFSKLRETIRGSARQRPVLGGNDESACPAMVPCTETAVAHARTARSLVIDLDSLSRPSGALRMRSFCNAIQRAVWFWEVCVNLSALQGRMHWSLLRLWTRTADATTHAGGQPGGSPATV